MNPEIQKSYPQTLHEECYEMKQKETVKYLILEEIQQTELTVRNLGSLCDRQFNNFSKYHKKQKFGFLTKSQTQQDMARKSNFENLDKGHTHRLTSYLDVKEDQNQYLVKKEGVIQGYNAYIFFQTLKISIQFPDQDPTFQLVPIYRLCQLNQFTQIKQRDMILAALKLSHQQKNSIETHFDQLGEEISDDGNQYSAAANIVISNFEISDSEQCKVVITFPFIFFSLKELNYDNDIILDNHQVTLVVSKNFSNIESIINDQYAEKQTDIINIKKLLNHEKQPCTEIIKFHNCDIKIIPKSVQKKEVNGNSRKVFEQKCLKKSFTSEDNKIFQVIFFPTQINYIPSKENKCASSIQCNLSIQEFIDLIEYSKENHIIDQLSEEITKFHLDLVKQMKEEGFDLETTTLNSKNSIKQEKTEENGKSSASFGIKKGKLGKSKMLLDLNFLPFNPENIQMIEDSHISNAILESQQKDFEIDYQKFEMHVTAPRFKITYDGKDEITIPCNAEILNIMIQQKFQFDLLIEK